MRVFSVEDFRILLQIKVGLAGARSKLPLDLWIHAFLWIRLQTWGFLKTKNGDTYIHGIHGDWCRGPQVEALLTHQWIRCGRPSVSLAGSSWGKIILNWSLRKSSLQYMKFFPFFPFLWTIILPPQIRIHWHGFERQIGRIRIRNTAFNKYWIMHLKYRVSTTAHDYFSVLFISFVPSWRYAWSDRLPRRWWTRWRSCRWTTSSWSCRSWHTSTGAGSPSAGWERRALYHR